MMRALLAIVSLLVALPVTAVERAEAQGYLLLVERAGTMPSWAGQNEKWLRAESGGWHAVESISFGSRSTPRRGERRMTIVRRVDDSSPILAAAHRERKRYPEATLILRKAGGEYVDYKFENVYIISYARHRSGDVIKEEIAFAYKTIK